MFQGYFRDEEATADAVDADGWLHTGDVGELDDDGYLTITDRKKDIIITAGGKNISPSEIENKLKVSPYVREAMVVGDRRKYLVALIGIELDTVGDWAARRSVAFTTYADLARKPEVRELIGERGRRASTRELAQVERIKKFALLEKELDHEDGELTATQKVKRRAHRGAASSRVIEELYVTEFLQLVLRRAGARRPLRAGRARLRDHLPGDRGHQLRPGRAGGDRRLPDLRVRQRRRPAVRARGDRSRSRAPALVGAAIERVVLRRMVGQPVFAVIMVTIGLLFIIEQAVTAIWGFDALNLADPWGVRTTSRSAAS